MGSTEANKKEGMQAISREILNGWIEQGFNNNAVAVYGGTTQVLENIINSGKIPQSPISLEYQKKLVEGGRYLYYALPFVGRIAKVDSRLVQSILDLDSKDHTAENPPIRFTTERMIHTAKGYALRQSIISPFLEIPGVSHSELLTLAQKITPKLFNIIVNESPYFYDEYEDDENTIANIKSRFSSSKLRTILSSCLKKRGVLIYFNSEIFGGNKVLPGHEDDKEIMIIADKPLPASTISGIEILSEDDMQTIQKYL